MNVSKISKILMNPTTIFLFLLFLISSATWVQVLSLLFGFHFVQIGFFVFDLINRPLILPPQIIVIISFVNIALLYLISNKLFSRLGVYLSLMMYFCAPWVMYLTAAGSIYIFLLFIVLVCIYGLVLFFKNENKWGLVLFVLGAVIGCYSSLLFSIGLIMGIGIITFLKLIPTKQLFEVIFVLILSLSPLVFFGLKNITGVKNIYNHQVSLLSDIALLNSVNSFQGESTKAGYGLLARAVENKYIYNVRYSVVAALKHVVPATYFTYNDQMLYFSSIPPLAVGWMIPIFYSLFTYISKKNYKWFVLSLVLIVPSVLSIKSPNLNRLILFFPVLQFFIVQGWVKLIGSPSWIARSFLYLLILILLLQSVIMLYDISLHETIRWTRFIDINTQMLLY